MTPRTTRLRQLIASRCVAMPGAYNALLARLVERAGFDAVYVSGAGLANGTAGVPDIGLLGLDEVVRLVGYITAAVKVPVLVDADTGFGSADNVARAVRELGRIGVAGLHLEDQVFPKRCGHLAGKAIVPVEEMVQKLQAAVAARTDPDLLIVARTDARAVEGFDAAVGRAQAYLGAGADAVFPEALQTEQEFAAFAQACHAPLLANMTEFGRGPRLDVPRLAQLGYRMVIFPQTLLRAGMKTAADCLADLRRDGTQSSWLDRMQTRQELYDLLDYDPAADRWT